MRVLNKRNPPGQVSFRLLCCAYDPTLLEDQIARGCHKDHGEDHAVGMDGGDGPDPFLESLDPGELFVCGFALDLRADLSQFRVAASEDGSKHEGDQPEARADAKPYPGA